MVVVVVLEEGGVVGFGVVDEVVDIGGVRRRV